MFDFNINENGELLFDSNTSDICCIYDDEVIKQIANNRIKSVVGNWFNSDIGANLEQYLGSPNSITTANGVMKSIENALTYDDFLSESEIYFIPKIDRTVLSIKVFIKSKYNSNPMLIDVTIDIVSGVKISDASN